MTFCVRNKNADILKILSLPKKKLNKISFIYHYEIVYINLQVKFVSVTYILRLLRAVSITFILRL